MNLDHIQSRIQTLQSEAHTIRKQYRRERKALQEAKKRLMHVQTAQKIALEVAEILERKAHSQISQVVSLCLSEIFGKDYDFQLEFTRKRSRTQINLNLLKEGHSVGNVLENDSGGVADVCAFGLRLSALMLSKPRGRKVLILDEPFRFLSKEYRPRLQTLLEKLSQQFQIQIIMVTHITDLQIGKVVSL